MKGLDQNELKRLLDAYDAALEMPEAQQGEWLAAFADDDPTLGAKLRDLLAARAQIQTNDFMQEPVWLRALGAAAADADDPGGAGDLVAGSSIGAYRLVRELGVGGMGAVWLAQRADGLFERPVALKLPHAGPFARVFARRFARERSILAALDHPHIARLHDAGVSANGQPFVALEYVEGVPLTEYCNEHRLGIAARVRLFIDVLQAVQYAHGQLVVHRDLKPANILVTADGGVKLLDFGIAKLVADSANEQTSLTQIGGLALTPDYASPEQITGSPIGVASDVYSLGVVLYELLVGRRPYTLQRQSRGALEEAIVVVDVGRPSEVAVEETVAQERASDPVRLQRQLKGELDTILLAALAKAPTARFGTCSAFAEDLQRYLDGRPLRVRPESRLRQVRKFVVRHRWSVGATAGVVLLVLGFALVALVQGSKAREEAARADAIRRFVVGVFERNSAAQPDPEKARATTARQLLDLGRDELLAAPSGEPAVAEALLDTFAEMYIQLGLGEEGLRLNRARLALSRTAFGELDPRTLDAQRGVATGLLNQDSADEERFTLATDLLAKLDRLGDQQSLLRARTHRLLAEVLNFRGDTRAFEHFKRGAELMRTRYPAHDEVPLALEGFAFSQLASGDFAGARVSILQALEAWRRTPRPLKTYGGHLYGIAGVIHEANDQLQDAEAAFREGVRLDRENYANSWQMYADWPRLGRLLLRTGRAAEVLEQTPAILTRLEALPEKPRWFLARILTAALAAAAEIPDLRALDRYAEALERVGCNHDPFTEVLCRQTRLDAARARSDMGAVAMLLNDVDALEQSLATRFPPAQARLSSIAMLTSIARAQIALGADAKADPILQRARQQLADGPNPSVVADLRLGLLERAVLVKRGDAAAARALTAGLRQRLAAHPDRALLKDYEQALGGP